MMVGEPEKGESTANGSRRKWSRVAECDCSLTIPVSIRIGWLEQSCEMGVRESWDWPLPGKVREGLRVLSGEGKNV